MKASIEVNCQNCHTKWTVKYKTNVGYHHVLIECRTCKEVFVKNLNTDVVVVVSKGVVEDLIDRGAWQEFEDYIGAMVNEAAIAIKSKDDKPITDLKIYNLKVMLDKDQDVDDFIKGLK